MGKVTRIVRSVQAFGRELTKGHASLLAAPLKPSSRPKIGIALGGGFARGVAHVGVLKVFEEEGIPIDFIAGTSSGAFIGALYCSGISALELAEIGAMVRFRDFARYTFSLVGAAKNDRMISMLGRMLKCKTFEELRIPLAVCATDFVSGEPVVFKSGELVSAVRASCAYPGIFHPVEVNGRLLVDGLLSHVVPSSPLREMGADRVLAVALSAHWCQKGAPRHIFEVIGQCFSIAADKMAPLWRPHADLVIEPDIACFGFDDFSRAPELVKVGETAARKALPQIYAWLENTEFAAQEETRSAPVQLSLGGGLHAPAILPAK